MHSSVLGFALVFIAAIAGGGLAVPLKKRRKFELENIYIPCTLVMMLILPFVMAAFVTPNWRQAMHRGGRRSRLELAPHTASAGASAPSCLATELPWRECRWALRPSWGSTPRLGPLLPFLVKSPADLLTSGGRVILVGIAGCVAGVAICGRAGFLRERQAGRQRPTAWIRQSSAGLRSIRRAERLRESWFRVHQPRRRRKPRGSARVQSSPRWPVGCLSSGERPHRFYCGLAACRSGEEPGGNNVGPDAVHDWLNGVLMGVIWFVATIPYGMGAYYLGRLGTSVGWAVYMAFTLLVANIFGFITA